MICGRCGAYADNVSLVCDQCGSLLSRPKEPEQDIQSFRQGKSQTSQKAGHDRVETDDIPVYGENDDQKNAHPDKQTPLHTNRSHHRRRLRKYEHEAGRPERRRGMPYTTGMPEAYLNRKNIKVRNPLSKHTVNWAIVFVAAVSVMLITAVAGFFYLTRTLQGQVIMARYNRATDSQAVWIVAEERLNEGYISEAITMLEQAWSMDQEKDPPIDHVDGLLLLCQAYEAGERLVDAVTLYTLLYQTIVPSRPEPYNHMIRIMLDNGEDREAGELMKTAYEKTQWETFRQRRIDLLPRTPETSLPSGRYSELKAVEFFSPQGYDVYYSNDADAVLPDEGLLYTDPIPLDEGITSFKVVCVSGRLIRDPMTTSYTIYLPSPSAPKARLAPGAYSKRQKVHLYTIDEDKNVRFYYTLDGSEPDIYDSPEYTGEAIALHTGNVNLKAIAVNTLGKISYAMDVKYRIDVKPYPEKVYDRTDTFGAFELMKTDWSVLQEQFGMETGIEEITIRGFNDPCRQYQYPWGYMTACVDKAGKTWNICQTVMNKAVCSLPRGIQFGDSSEAVTARFRDCTQPPGISGNRGLYYSDTGMGRFYRLSDHESMVKYTCLSQDGNVLSLEFFFADNHLTSVKHEYIVN
jgi:hypothetical protein